MKSKKPALKGTMVTAMILLVVIYTSCDVLRSDPDLKKPSVEVVGGQIYALSTGSTFIDLNSRIETNQTVTFTVTSSTHYGDLTGLTKGLFRYAPGAVKSGTHDAFKFTVYNQASGVLVQDSLTIVIADSTHLPCGIYPVDDYVHFIPGASPSGHQTIFIDVLSNDILCNYDSADAELSVYQPDQSYGPHAGTAQVTALNQGGHSAFDLGIDYTPLPSFNGTDQFIYKIQSRSTPSLVAYGIVYISTQDRCVFSLTDDTYKIGKDTIPQVEAGIHFSVFSNDILCDSVNSYQYHIADQPVFGSATIDATGITYRTTPMSPGQARLDSIHYEVCLPSKCLKAKVTIYLWN